MKVGLVLEGGGMRGAYTAGVLAWFLKEEIEFDYAVGISAGAQHLVNFLTKDAAYLKKVAVEIGANEFSKGLKPLLKEGNLVSYDHLFGYVIEKIAPLDLAKAKANSIEAEVGVYDLQADEAIFVNVKDLDKDHKILKAASTIPFAGKPVKINGKKYVDAGAAYMIPIKRSIEKNMDKHIVVTTKPETYTRKPTGFLTNFLLFIFYNKYKNFRKLIKNRSEIYYEQKHIVSDLSKKGQAFELYPSKSFNIGRFGGDVSELEDLFETGFNDCENQKAEIYKFLELNK